MDNANKVTQFEFSIKYKFKLAIVQNESAEKGGGEEGEGKEGKK